MRSFVNNNQTLYNIKFYALINSFSKMQTYVQEVFSRSIDL